MKQIWSIEEILQQFILVCSWAYQGFNPTKFVTLLEILTLIHSREHNCHPQKKNHCQSVRPIKWLQEIFFLTVILLLWKTEVKRLSSLRNWRRNRFGCKIFRLCIWCKKFCHLDLHGYFDLQSWLFVWFFCHRLWFCCLFLYQNTVKEM